MLEGRQVEICAVVICGMVNVGVTLDINLYTSGMCMCEHYLLYSPHIIKYKQAKEDIIRLKFVQL